MAANYYLTLTDYGSQLVAAAHGQATIGLVNLVLGDANGLPYDPVTKVNRTSLVNQRAVVPVQSVIQNNGMARVVATIDSTIGGFNIHELGLTDHTGQLVYIGNYHGGYKPSLTQGAGGELALYMDIKANAGSQVLIQLSPNNVTANRQWVLDNFVLLSVYNAFVAQNQLEHNNLLALITTEAQTRQQQNDDLTTDLTALAESAQNQLNFLAAQIASEIIARQLGDASLNTRIDQQFDFYGTSGNPTIYPVHYAANGRATGAAVDYTTESYSVYVMPKGLLKQTVRVRTTQQDANLHIYLPIAAKNLWHIADSYQSVGRSASSPAGDDDSTSRIVQIYEEDTGNNQKRTVIVVRSDQVSNAEDYDGERFISLEVTCSGFNLPTYLQDSGAYPYPRTES